MKSKSILVVGNINHFSPRITSYCQEWINEKNTIITILSPSPENHTISHLLKNHKISFISLGRTKSNIEYLRDIFIKIRNIRQPNRNFDSSQILYPIKMRNKFLFLAKTLCFPDEESEFLIKAFRFAHKMNLADFDFIISSAPYFSSHVIAHFMKKKNKDLFWLADCRDTFSTNPTYRVAKFRKWLDKKFENYILSSSDIITTVSKAYKMQLESVVKKNIPIKIMPSGYRHSHFERRNGERIASENIIFIGYYGQYFDEYYPTDYIYEVLSKLKEELYSRGYILKINFFGCTNPVIARKLSNLGAIFTKRLSRNEIDRIQRKADINLIFSNGCSEHFGLSHLKLYEYLHAGRMVLAITEGVTEEIKKADSFNKNFIIFDSKNNSASYSLLENICKKVIENVRNPHNFYVRPAYLNSSKVLSKSMFNELCSSKNI